MIDQRGASPLHWAAGSGHLDVTRYLIEECECDPNKGQKGKRSFSGRTSLHWAARNGHLEIVQYLVRTCSVDLEAATIDGTTAFCWAAWQGHLKIMEYVNARLGGQMEFCLCLTLISWYHSYSFLHAQGCNIHTANSFGCNAVLWCAQGKGEVAVLEWLAAEECNLALVNNNAHGVVHKAAQRGWKLGCIWFFENIMKAQTIELSLELVGPDTEG
jgi:ankyrin repeat protein